MYVRGYDVVVVSSDGWCYVGLILTPREKVIERERE